MSSFLPLVAFCRLGSAARFAGFLCFVRRAARAPLLMMVSSSGEVSTAPISSAGEGDGDGEGEGVGKGGGVTAVGAGGMAKSEELGDTTGMVGWRRLGWAVVLRPLVPISSAVDSSDSLPFLPAARSRISAVTLVPLIVRLAGVFRLGSGVTLARGIPLSVSASSRALLSSSSAGVSGSAALSVSSTSAASAAAAASAKASCLATAAVLARRGWCAVVVGGGGFRKLRLRTALLDSLSDSSSDEEMACLRRVE